MAGFAWTVPPEEAWGDLADAYVKSIQAGVLGVMQSYEKGDDSIENYMKEHAPWDDKSGNARQALWTDINQEINQMVEMILSHGMDYGIYLELKNSGRFAIINPSLDLFAPKIWADVVKMLS